MSYKKSALPPSPIDRVHAAVSDQSLLGRVLSGFVARLNTHTITRNTEELRARIAYTQEVGRLADASLERDRKLARYFYDRDELIEDDRAEHRLQMELNRLERERRLRQVKERDELAALDHETAVADARNRLDRAKYGQEAFQQSLPLRKERLDHLFKSGALDAEIGMLARDERRNEFLESKRASAPDSDALSRLLEALDQEIALANARHASQDVLDAYAGLRARVSAMQEVEKNRPR